MPLTNDTVSLSIKYNLTLHLRRFLFYENRFTSWFHFP